jgi:hypothetical protein
MLVLASPLLQQTYVKLEHPLKAPEPIVVKVEGSSNNLRLEQLRNALASIVVTPS